MDVVMRTERTSTELQEVRIPVSSSFPPKATIKCDGIPAFRNKAARDLACLSIMHIIRWHSSEPLVNPAGQKTTGFQQVSRSVNQGFISDAARRFRQKGSLE